MGECASVCVCVRVRVCEWVNVRVRYCAKETERVSICEFRKNSWVLKVKNEGVLNTGVMKNFRNKNLRLIPAQWQLSEGSIDGKPKMVR